VHREKHIQEGGDGETEENVGRGVEKDRHELAKERLKKRDHAISDCGEREPEAVVLQRSAPEKFAKDVRGKCIPRQGKAVRGLA
jgi:hypothetical protein